MSRTTRLWGGASLILGALAACPVWADDEPSLADQLIQLARQAKATGATATAHRFYENALRLDPTNPDAKQGLKSTEEVMRVAFQDAKPAQTPPQAPAAAGGDARATVEQSVINENIARQQLTSDIEQRLKVARELLNQGQAEAAINALRLAQNVIKSSTNVPQEDRDNLERRVQAQLIATSQAEERVVADRAQQARLEAAAEQRSRSVAELQQNKKTIEAMMIQFDLLMRQGVYNVLYNGGMGDILAATAPFNEARLLAVKAYALQRGGPLPYSDNDPSPAAGKYSSYYMGFLAQGQQFKYLEQYRTLLSLQDVDRAAVPFPDTQTIEYPDAEWFRTMSERRINRWGKAVDLFERDPKTRQILEELEKPLTMSFPNETSLDDILKYIKQATTTATFPGIPIYVDPIGLSEAEKEMTSTVTIDLEGVPLKTTLRLLLKQLDLTYTVKDGYMMITSKESEDQQTEIRVYPVADLAMIPLSLMGGGMMGGMGGGMMGGMGGMMGGMGGMGGGGMMGGGMMGGMMSVPPVDPQSFGNPQEPGFAQKKSN